MVIICSWVIAAFVSPFLNSGLCLGLTKMKAANNVKVFFISYINVLLLSVVVTIFLSHFEKDFVMLGVAYGTGCIFFTIIGGERYFVSSTLSQQAVTIHYLTSRFTTKTVVLPVEQIKSAKLSAGKGWYRYPHRYTIAFNDEEGKFYMLNPITSNDFFYLADNNADTNTPKPADV